MIRKQTSGLDIGRMRCPNELNLLILHDRGEVMQPASEAGSAKRIRPILDYLIDINAEFELDQNWIR
jgi:hypothetical protein